jgi:hypothetical protein
MGLLEGRAEAISVQLAARCKRSGGFVGRGDTGRNATQRRIAKTTSGVGLGDLPLSA